MLTEQQQHTLTTLNHDVDIQLSSSEVFALQSLLSTTKPGLLEAFNAHFSYSCRIRELLEVIGLMDGALEESVRRSRLLECFQIALPTLLAAATMTLIVVNVQALGRAGLYQPAVVAGVLAVAVSSFFTWWTNRAKKKAVAEFTKNTANAFRFLDYYQSTNVSDETVTAFLTQSQSDPRLAGLRHLIEQHRPLVQADLESIYSFLENFEDDNAVTESGTAAAMEEELK